MNTAVDESQTQQTDTVVDDIEIRNAIALPIDVTAMIANRKTRLKITLNDQVDQVHLHLYSDPEYQRFLDAVYNENAVEGSIHIDDTEAARMIRNYARDEGYPYIAGQNLATIVKSLNVVLRRYGMSRKERREA